MKRCLKVKFWLFIVAFVVIFGSHSNLQAQFNLRAPLKVGDSVNCYVPGDTYVRKVDPRGINGGFAFSLKSNNDVQAIFDDISAYIEVEEEINVMASTTTESAEACRSDNGVYFILFNPAWLRNLYADTKSIWALRAVIAHEVGHIVFNHSVKYSRSRPDLELQADWYAGKVLAKMGAELSEVESAFRSKEFASANATKTHPDLDQRLKGVRDGWSSVNSENVSPSNKPTKPTPTGKFIARCIFFGEPIIYMVDSNNNIIGYHGNESKYIGKRIASTYPEFVWMYAINGGLVYGVDKEGRIWNRTFWGTPFQIGVIQKP